jgi:hypothetical protein
MSTNAVRIAAAASCALLLAALGWAAFAPVDVGSREQVYRIPKGTFAKRMAGHYVEVLPSRIHLMLGVKDILVLRNDDDVPQMFGPVLIMPGQRFELPFRLASHYQFACSLHQNGQLAIDVDPPPSPGWRRLAWRTKGALAAWLGNRAA